MLEARQLAMTRAQLLKFVKCDLTKEDYVRQLRDAGRIPTPKKE